MRTYKHSQPGEQGDRRGEGDSRKVSRGKTRGKPCVAGFPAAGEPVPSPARRFLPGAAGLAGESAHGTGHRSTVRRSGRHAGWRGITEGCPFGGRRSAGFERILYLAGPALPTVQDAVDHTRVCDEGDDPHACAAGANQGSVLKIFRIRRIHVLRASLDGSGWSRSVRESAAAHSPKQREGSTTSAQGPSMRHRLRSMAGGRAPAASGPRKNLTAHHAVRANLSSAARCWGGGRHTIF